MTSMRTLLFLPLTLCAGCTSASLTAAAHPVRILASEVTPAPMPEAEAPQTQPAEKSPRIGAPGGSGAGSRRVAPAHQSGNETVGGLPAGIGAGVDAAGRG